MLLPRVLNLLIKCIVESVDRAVLGVDVHVRNMSIGCSRTLEIEDLIVDNPVGYTTGYLLKMSRLEVGVSLWSAVRSRGKRIHVSFLEISHLEVNCECSMDNHGLTNIKVVQDFIDGVSIRVLASGKEIRHKPKKSKPPEYILHMVLIEKIQVNVCMTHPLMGVQTQAVTIRDIHFEDFAEEHPVVLANDIIRHLAKAVLNAAMAGTATVRKKVHESFMDALQVAKQHATNVKMLLAEKALRANSSVGRAFEDVKAKADGAFRDLQRGRLSSSSSSMSPELARLRQVLLQTGLRPGALCPATGLTQAHLHFLIHETATAEDRRVPVLWQELAGSRALLSQALFEAWLRGEE